MTANVALENGGNASVSENKIATKTELESMFPSVTPNIRPFGSRVLVQIRRPRSVSRGGIIFSEQSKETELDNTCVAKVLSVGPLAYKNRNTMEPWAEGQWCQPGAFVYVPKYGGVRWEKDAPKQDGFHDKVQFAIFDDLNVIGEVEDPSEIKAHI